MSVMDTREKILLVARKTVQAHGYNALSFRDLAAEVGIKSASVHYHFPTKGDLGAALARRYTEDGQGWLTTIGASQQDLPSRMKNYTDIFRAALVDDNRMCLCGIMTAETDSLPPEVRAEVNRFGALNVEWLSQQLLSGRPDASQKGAARQRALAIFSAIAGAQLTARGQGDVAVYDDIIASYRDAGLIP